MNALSRPEVRHVHAVTAGAPAGSNYVLRWQSSFGVILIEVRDGLVFVNGDFVQPAQKPSSSSGWSTEDVRDGGT